MSPDKYRHACILVSELLITLYEDYKRFCDKFYKDPMNNLTIKKVETIGRVSI